MILKKNHIKIQNQLEKKKTSRAQISSFRQFQNKKHI